MKKVKFLSSVLMFGAIVLLFNRCTNTDDLIKPGDGNQPIVVETNIYGEDFGTTAVQTGTAWPAVAAYDGYSKLGIGAGAVTYSAEGGAVTVRANSNSSGYSGASGSCNAMMAASGGALVINDIATCGATNLKLSFGSNETNDVIAVSYKINGTTNWVAIPYTKTNSAWGLVENLSITLPTGANTIKLKFT
ncbi:MAG: hypothetical protein FWF72_00285, partial [Paludibacter sp.]|nr:hypothetical protein [Paludibacter sp.]